MMHGPWKYREAAASPEPVLRLLSRWPTVQTVQQRSAAQSTGHTLSMVYQMTQGLCG